MADPSTVHVSRLKRAHIRDIVKFPSGRTDDHHIVCDDEMKENAAGSSIVTGLGSYSEIGSAIAEVEREQQLQNADHRPRTRAAVHRAHDRGEVYDYVQLRLTRAWSDAHSRCTNHCTDTF